METKVFLTQEFYTDPQLTLDIFNQLVEKKQVASIDMYKSGTFRFFEVYENEETKSILAPIIADLDAYKAYNNENYTYNELTQINLGALQDEHTSAFKHLPGYKSISWSYEYDEFVFEEDNV